MTDIDVNDMYLNVTVIGLGYIGSVAAMCLADAGHSVIGVDINPDVVSNLQYGKLHIYEPGLEEIYIRCEKNGRLPKFVTLDNFESQYRNNLGDIIMVTVGTPINHATGKIDTSYVESLLSRLISLFKYVDDKPVWVMKSTLPPMYAEYVANTLFEHGIGYVYNPEFLREGSAIFDWVNTDRIILGTSNVHQRSMYMRYIDRLYHNIDAQVLCTDVKTAAMIKLVSNALLASRISFMNEIADICDAIGANVLDVSHGVSMDSRLGSPIYAGLGYGGSCFPKDVKYLMNIAKECGKDFRILENTSIVNSLRSLKPVEILSDFVSQRGLEMRNLKVAVLGISFKPNTDDIRDAPSVNVLRSLIDKSVGRISIYDPVAIDALKKNHLDIYKSVVVSDSVESASMGANVVILVTEWEEIVSSDWEQILHNMEGIYLVIDGRNVLNSEEMKNIGFEYIGFGQG